MTLPPPPCGSFAAHSPIFRSTGSRTSCRSSGTPTGRIIWKDCAARAWTSLGSKIDVVADIVRPLDDPIIERTRAGVAFMRVPIDAPPAFFPPERDQFFDQGAPRPSPANLRRNKDILQIANRFEAPGMGMQDIIGEALRLLARR